MFHSLYEAEADECVYCYYFPQVKYYFRRLFGRLISSVLFLAVGVIFSKPKFVSLTHPLRIILWFSVILRDKTKVFSLTYKLSRSRLCQSSSHLTPFPTAARGKGLF